MHHDQDSQNGVASISNVIHGPMNQCSNIGVINQGPSQNNPELTDCVGDLSVRKVAKLTACRA